MSLEDDDRLFLTEESRVWLQTRRILDRRQTPRAGMIESTAPREAVDQWMQDEIDRYRVVEGMRTVTKRHGGNRVGRAPDRRRGSQGVNDDPSRNPPACHPG